jgi:hypothetical protein
VSPDTGIQGGGLPVVEEFGFFESPVGIEGEEEELHFVVRISVEAEGQDPIAVFHFILEECVAIVRAALESSAEYVANVVAGGDAELQFFSAAGGADAVWRQFVPVSRVFFHGEIEASDHERESGGDENELDGECGSGGHGVLHMRVGEKKRKRRPGF